MIERDRRESKLYPSVIRRVETGISSQPLLFEWVWHESLVPRDGSFAAVYTTDGYDGALLGQNPDDEDPEVFDTLEEAIDALWRQGPQTLECE